jgi:hypothetical protein
MRTLSYGEAKSWFWIRTWMWMIPAIIVTIMGSFAVFWHVPDFTRRFWFAVISGVGTVLIGLAVAAVSVQFPWMQAGSKFAFVLNGVTCAIIAGALAFVVGNVLLSIVFNDMPNFATHPKAYETFSRMYRMSHRVMRLSSAAGGAWGFAIGIWFALRHDKYFLDRL